MTYDEFNVFCGELPGATYVLQWGGSHVWKVSGKVFAVGGWNDDDVGITFKASPVAYEVLKDLPGLRPAPYMASRGLKWIQHHAEPGLSDDELRDYLRRSYGLVRPREVGDAAVRARATPASIGRRSRRRS